MWSHSVLLIVITVAISLIAFSQRRVLESFIFWGPAVKRGDYYRFVSYGFIHADFFYLLFNMITLYFFGQVVETFYRQFAAGMGFVIFYLVAMVISIIPSYLKHGNNPQWSSLGASGAVSAILFSFILFQPWNLILVFFIPMPAIVFAILYVGYSLWAERRNRDYINHSAHLWGAFCGVVITIILDPRVIPHFFNALLNPRF